MDSAPGSVTLTRAVLLPKGRSIEANPFLFKNPSERGHNPHKSAESVYFSREGAKGPTLVPREDQDLAMLKLSVTPENWPMYEGKIAVKNQETGVFDKTVASFDELLNSKDQTITIDGTGFTHDQLSKLGIEVGRKDKEGNVLYRELEPVTQSQGERIG